MANLRKKYSAEQKAKIALEALKGESTQSQLTSKYQVHGTQVNNWKRIAKEGAIEAFRSKKKQSTDHDKDKLIEELYKEIGKQKVELDWIKKKSELFD